MTLQELSCFLEVGKVLNFSKAAEKLYISQPAVSKYIRRLEEELGVRLLERSVRREVTLTEAGRILLESLKQCEDVFAQGMEQLSLLKGAGSVTVSLTEDCNLPDLMMQRFSRVFARLSAIEVNFAFISHEKIEASVESGRLVICTRESVPEHMKCQASRQTLTKASYYMLVSVRHPVFQRTDHPKLSEFAEYPLLLSRTLPGRMIEFFEEAAERTMGYEPKRKLLDNTDGVILHLRGHIGYTIVTEWFKNFHDQDFYALPLGIPTEYVLLWKPDRVQNEKIREMIRMLGEQEP